MGSVGGLRVHSWVPIIVVENNGICCNQIDTQTTRSRGKNEDENIWISLELLYHEPSILELRRSIHSEVSVLLPYQEILQNVHHPCHLTKN